MKVEINTAIMDSVGLASVSASLGVDVCVVWWHYCRLCAMLADGQSYRRSVLSSLAGIDGLVASLIENGLLEARGDDVSLPAVVSKKRRSSGKDTDQCEFGTLSWPIMHAESRVLAEAWRRYCEHRRAKRAKMTRHAAELIVRKLSCYSPEDAARALDASVANGWTGVFEPESGAGGSNGHSSHIDDRWYGL